MSWTKVYFVRVNESRVRKGLRWTFLTLIVGWWGVPFGPIYTIVSILDESARRAR